MKRKAKGTVTRYPALDAFRAYLDGTGTLEEFQKAPTYTVEYLASERAILWRPWRAGFVWGLLIGGVLSIVINLAFKS